MEPNDISELLEKAAELLPFLETPKPTNTLLELEIQEYFPEIDPDKNEEQCPPSYV